eukprot:8390580-Alexandrium_andersonii.AAC.1
MRTPAGEGTHSARRWDHWTPGDHMRGAGPSPRGSPLVSQRMATANDAMPSKMVTPWIGSALKTTRRRDLGGRSSSAHGVPPRP